MRVTTADYFLDDLLVFHGSLVEEVVANYFCDVILFIDIAFYRCLLFIASPRWICDLEGLFRMRDCSTANQNIPQITEDVHYCAENTLYVMSAPLITSSSLMEGRI